jgi:hypothetical protein
MAKYTVAKVSCISVTEIQEHKKSLTVFSQKREEALKELSAYLKEICSKTALTIPGMVTMMRSLRYPPISEDLRDLIQSSSNWKLRGYFDQLIIANHGGDYSSFNMRKGWDRTKKKFFGRWYYYYDQPFINVYNIANDQLLLYINHDWEETTYKKVYMDRMLQLSIEG